MIAVRMIIDYGLPLEGLFCRAIKVGMLLMTREKIESGEREK